MEFDFGRLRRGEQIVGIGAVALFVLMFFDWYSVSVSGTAAGFSRSVGVGGGSAWQAFGFIDIYLLLTVVVALTLVALTATQRTPALPVTTSVITAAVSALAAVLVLFRLVDAPGGGSESFGGVTINVDVSPTLWAFLGFLAVLAIVYGSYLSMRDEGTTLDDVRGQASAAATQARAAFDGAAPAAGGAASTAPPPASTPPAPPPPPAPAEPEAGESTQPPAPAQAAPSSEPPPLSS